MKASLLQQNLDNGLSITSRIIQPTNSLPILGNVLLTAKKGSLELQATNLELSVRYNLAAKVEEEGSCSLPARLFSDIIHALTDDKIQLTTEKDNVVLRSEGFHSVMNGLNAQDFPRIPEISTTNTLQLKTNQFIELVEEVLPAVSLDESRPILAGVLFTLKDNILRLAATDSYRLSENTIKINEKNDISVIIPHRALSEVIRIAGIISPEGIVIHLSETEIIFEIGQAQLISQLIEGQYPDYAKIIPEKSTTKLSVEKNELIRSIKIASLFSRENAHSIELEITTKGLVIHSKASDVGTNSSQINCKVTGNSVSINVNAKYLLDAISIIKSDTINLAFTQKLEPCVVTPEGKYPSDYIHIIMPLRS